MHCLLSFPSRCRLHTSCLVHKVGKRQESPETSHAERVHSSSKQSEKLVFWQGQSIQSKLSQSSTVKHSAVATRLA